MSRIPFNKPYLTGNEINFIKNAHARGQLAGDGFYSKSCSQWLEQKLNIPKVLLTHSATAALEMAAILINIKPGDEIIMPSYTFVSTANAFVLRGGIPVFVDIHPDTLNINETLIEERITEKTKAIVAVHYAGITCEMNKIKEICLKYGLFLIEDAAQAILSEFETKKLGSIGDLSCISFHETKNIISGEGGALLINNKELIERAEIVREKGTDRTRFFKGEIDKYTWRDIGSSYLPGEIIAAFLLSQLEHSDEITQRRLDIWHEYGENLEESTIYQKPKVNKSIKHNGHIYYLLFKESNLSEKFINYMNDYDIHCTRHYFPLHLSSMAKTFITAKTELKVTEKIAGNLVRLPIWLGIEDFQEKIIETINNFERIDS